MLLLVVVISILLNTITITTIVTVCSSSTSTGSRRRRGSSSRNANHALRNIPPEDVRPYAEGRDLAVCATLQACLGEQTAEAEPLASTAWALAATPATHGGLGLQSAIRTAPAAYWGAWADTLGYWHVRQPRLASACVQALEGGGAGRPALCAAHAAANLLRSEGWQECPTWAELLSTSCAAPCAREAGPGDWPHSWQFHASRTRSLYFRDRVLLPTLEPAHQALVLSQSGPQAAARLTAIPADRSTSLPPEVMQIALRSASGCHSLWPPASAANMGTDAEGG